MKKIVTMKKNVGGKVCPNFWLYFIYFRSRAIRVLVLVNCHLVGGLPWFSFMCNNFKIVSVRNAVHQLS